MSQNINVPASDNDFTKIQADRPSVVAGSTKDTGRVKVGGSGIRYKDPAASTKDAGRVRIGGSGIRY